MKNKTPSGIFTATRKDNSIYYRSFLTIKGKHISLGSFDEKDKAKRCVETAERIWNSLQIVLEDYTNESALAFEKWVVLINYRDHGIYSSNPIYLRNSYFDYYLSPGKVLKFDKDDLFYYSSHKIMERGNHLFVSDYGIQVNLLNRYGIMSYSVPGRDYLFKNGDSLDFRYGNIEIINRFRGVMKKTVNAKTVYEARIHVNGYYKIGTYPTEISAAIAYNKAVDILSRNGLEKNYSTNYIDHLSPKEYADIYSSVEINPRITNYHLTL